MRVVRPVLRNRPFPALDPLFFRRPGGTQPADGSLPLFYVGLGLISFATGLILPSVSALVSLYSPASEQGRNLGILRSAGSLARIIGPVSAALLYFHFGSHLWVYLSGALLMLPALWLVRGLPDPVVAGEGS